MLRRLLLASVTNSALFSSDGSSLSGWNSVGTTAVDSTIGNPAPSLKINDHSQVNRLVSGSPVNWKVDMCTPLLCDFHFMCDSAGNGMYFRLETRSGQSCGISTSNGFGSFPTAPTGASAFGNRVANTWYSYEIIYNPTARTVDVKENGTLVLSGVAVANPVKGNYIALAGDTLNQPSYFDNIIVS